MEIFSSIEATQIDDVAPGSVFIGKVGDVNLVGVAIARRPESEGAFIALNHPNLSGVPGVLMNSTLQRRCVFVVKGAMLVSEVDVASMDVSVNSFKLKPGMLALEAGHYFIAAAFNSYNDIIYVNAESGEEGKLELHKAAVFKKWSVMFPNERQELDTLCAIKVPTVD